MTPYRPIMHRYVILALLLLARAAAAADLTLGVQVEPTALDPHFANVDTNNAVALHFFTPLVVRNERLEPKPGLATAWRLVDDTTWEFTLRRGVTFHDGSPFTAEDVKFSIERARTIPNSPSPLTVYVRQITGIEIVDPYTVRLRTAEVFPLMPIFMGTFVMVSKKAAEGLTTAELNAGRGLVGTGPFRFVEWVRGDRLVMERFDGYWGDKPAWDKVVMRPIPSAPARLAGLLSGTVDLIDFVPTTDLPRLAQRPDIALSQGVTCRLIFLSLDVERERSPFVTDKTGKPLAANPLRDARVRRALSLAIDRDGIARRLMDGASAPTLQIMPANLYGHVPDIPPSRFDAAAARRLLAEAGWDKGFGLTLHVPQNRYVNDVKTMEAIAQMLQRIGIEAKVETVPVATFFTRSSQREFSAFMIGFGLVTGEPGSFLALALQTYDAQRQIGGGNRGRYSSAAVDAVIDQALRTVDDGARLALLQRATRMAVVDDAAIVPLHHQVHTWAMRKGLKIVTRTDEYTLAQDVTPAN